MNVTNQNQSLVKNELLFMSHYFISLTICDPVSQTSRKVGKNDFEIRAKM